jgi:hypothetical protein
MLELRPTCEHCNTPLLPDALEARICSYECTFCAACVESVLNNVCPNCGGGFAPRPVRPAINWAAALHIWECGGPTPRTGCQPGPGAPTFPAIFVRPVAPGR